MQVEREESCAEARDPAEVSDDGRKIVKEDLCGSSSSLADSSDSSSSFQDDDDDDSLELSESESITDVTPLNSPYCDSPMPQAKDRHLLEASRSTESQESASDRGEMNVLMQAIEKLEVEKSRRIIKQRGPTGDFVSGKRPEPENQRLFKQAIAQQNRAKKAGQDRLCRRSTVINRYKISLDAESPVPLDGTSMEANARKSTRKQKCLSHPSCQPYPYPLPESQHPCGLASKTIMHRSNAPAEAVPDVESEMIAH